MRTPEQENAIQHLLTAFNIVAPSGKEQRAMIAALREMADEGETGRAQILAIADAISNGLRHGNWVQETA